MPELPSKAKVEVSFQEFLDNYEGHDIGLQMFDGKIRRLTDAANEDIGSFSDLIEPGVESLNEEWLYHDDTAVVSGRLHVIDGSVIAELTKQWGEPDKDEQGNLSFFVDDLKLRSYGIHDGPHGAPLSDDAVEARIGYGFVLSDSNFPMAQLILYPGEAAKHHYTLPTPQAIEAKLHGMWPEKMAIVDRLLSAEDTKVNDLPRRLAFVARHLQNELVGSSDAREWLSVHVNERLLLDKVWPYALSAKETLFFLDDESGQQWQELSIDRPTRLDVRRPRIEFIKNDSDEAVQAMFFAELPDSDDEWGGTAVGVKVTDIMRMRGTRAHRSIVDRALQGNERNFAAALESVEDFNFDDTEEEPEAIIKSPRAEHHGGFPEFIKEMIFLREELGEVMDMLRPIAQKRYDSYEQAFEVSQALSNTIGNRLIGAGIANYALSFEGRYALRAKTLRGGYHVDPGETLIKVDADQPFAEQMHGDNFTGTFYAFVGDVVPETDEDEEREYFHAVPRIIVDTKTEVTSGLNYGPISMLEINVQQRGLAALDGSVQISIPSLSRYEADMDARNAVAARLGSHSVTKKVHRLFAALHTETNDGYQDLARIDDVRSIARYAESAPEGEPEVFEAISSLFMNRGIMTVGEEAGTDGEIRFVDGVVVDVTMSVLGTDKPGPYITLVDKYGDKHVSLRVSSLESISF